MNRRMVMVGNLNSFLFKTVVQGLRDVGILVDVVMPFDLRDYSEKNKADLILFYLNDDMETYGKVFEFIEDEVRAKHVKLGLIGSTENFRKLKTYLPQEVITFRCLRPVEMDWLIKQVAELLGIKKLKKHVLLVDDTPETMRSICNILEQEYRVTMVTSGSEAISYLKRNSVDLVLLDYEMPVLDGPKVLNIIKKNHEIDEVPVMFLTAKNDVKSVLTGLSLRPEQYLLKSQAPEELLKSIEFYFEQIEKKS